MGSGQLPAGARQRLHRGDRRDGHGADDALVGLPDQDLRRAQRPRRRLRHGGRRLAVARRRLDRRPLRRPDRLPEQGQPQGPLRPGDAEVLRRVRRQVLVGPARGRRQRLGVPQGLVRGPEGDGRLQGEVRLRPRGAEGLQAAPRHRRVLHPARREPLRPRALHPDLLRRAGDGRRADHLHLRRRSRRLRDRQGRRHHQLAAERRGAASSTTTSTSSPRRTGASRSSWRTTRPSPRAWWR